MLCCGPVDVACVVGDSPSREVLVLLSEGWVGGCRGAKNVEASCAVCCSSLSVVPLAHLALSYPSSPRI